MDCTVTCSEIALTDLQEITAYIAVDNLEAAERFANRLVDLAESLRQMPGKGRRVKNWPDVRVVVLSPYLIFYRFDTNEKWGGSVAFLAWRERSRYAANVRFLWRLGTELRVTADERGGC